MTFTVPKRGEKLDLLEFSLKSARIYRAEQLKNLEIKNPERHTERLMAAMQRSCTWTVRPATSNVSTTPTYRGPTR